MNFSISGKCMNRLRARHPTDGGKLASSKRKCGKLDKKRDLLTSIAIRAMILKGHADVARMRKNAKHARRVNDKLLFSILRKGKNSAFGKDHHFDQIKTIEDYRRLVPISTYADYKDYVARIVDDEEQNVLTTMKTIGFAQSSGSSGTTKVLPVTQPQVDMYKDNTITRVLALADSYHWRKTGKGLKPGRGLYPYPSFDQTLPNGKPANAMPDIAAKQFGFIYPYILTMPFSKHFKAQEVDFRYLNMRFALEDESTLYIFCIFFKAFTDILRYLELNWEVLVDDIEKGTVSDIARATPEVLEKLAPKIAPNPKRAAELRREFEKGFDDTIIRRIWPNLAVISGIGTSTFAPFSKIARNYTAGIPFDFSIYGASEGMMAAVDELESAKQLLLVDGCYMEFIPESDQDKILAIDELEVGEEYEIVLTNQAGLYRYKCGDVVKVLDYLYECPYIMFSRRKGQLLNMTGEKTTEEHMAKLVAELSKEVGCPLENWAAYICLDSYPYHYALLLENNEGIDMRAYNELADKLLREINPRYGQFIDFQEMGPIKLENQKPGTHDAWTKRMFDKGAPVGQIKPVRILDTSEKEEFFLNRVVEDEG